MIPRSRLAAALAAAALLLAAPALALGEEDESKLADGGSTFLSGKHGVTFAVPKSAGLTLSVDKAQLAEASGESQKLLVMGATEPGQEIILYLAWHPTIDEETALDKYVESLESNMKANFEGFSKDGSSTVKTMARGDYSMKQGGEDHRTVMLFAKSARRFYNFVVMTKKSEWLKRRDDVEAIVKSFDFTGAPAAAGGEPETRLVDDGLTFVSEKHGLTLSFPKSAGVTLSVDADDLAKAGSEDQKMLLMGAAEPGQEVLLYLATHPGFDKDADATKYCEAIEQNMVKNFEAFGKDGRISVDATTVRGDYTMKSGADEYRAVMLFAKRDGRFYNFVTLTKKSEWLKRRDDIEKAVKSFGPLKKG